MSNILIKNMKMPEDDILRLEICPDGQVNRILGWAVSEKRDAKAIGFEDPDTKEYYEKYEYFKKGSDYSVMLKVASELSMLIHCEKNRKVGDVIDSLCAMRNALWDREDTTS